MRARCIKDLPGLRCVSQALLCSTAQERVFGRCPGLWPFDLRSPVRHPFRTLLPNFPPGCFGWSRLLRRPSSHFPSRFDSPIRPAYGSTPIGATITEFEPVPQFLDILLSGFEPRIPESHLPTIPASPLLTVVMLRVASINFGQSHECVANIDV